MKILFITPYPIEGASSRYRIYEYLPFLEKENISYRLRPFFSSKKYNLINKVKYLNFIFFVTSSVNRLLDFFRAFFYDIIFIHREAFPFGAAFFEKFLKMFNKKFIIDFDDAIFLPYAKKSKIVLTLLPKDRLLVQVKYANYVLVGNSYLKSLVAPFNKNIAVIPTAIDVKRFLPVKKNNETLIIGWIGSNTTSEYLKELFCALEKLALKYEFFFKIVGANKPIDISNVKTINLPWSLDREVKDFQDIDIGVYPLPDNQWTRGKCGFKAIQFMSCGIPVVASPVGVNKEIIIDGVNGFLADSESEWVEKIAQLIEKEDLRKKMGGLGRKTIEERYSLEVTFTKIVEILHLVNAK